LETIAGIGQSFEELNAGQTRPIGDFVQEMQQIVELLNLEEWIDEDTEPEEPAD
jgi:hypothetical protein